MSIDYEHIFDTASNCFIKKQYILTILFALATTKYELIERGSYNKYYSFPEGLSITNVNRYYKNHVEPLYINVYPVRMYSSVYKLHCVYYCNPDNIYTVM